MLLIVGVIMSTGLTQTNVPGRKAIVTAAILWISPLMSLFVKSSEEPYVIIAELSRCVSIAISDVRFAISKFVRLALCVSRLKNRLMRIFVLSL